MNYMGFRRLVRYLRKLPVSKVNNRCPECNGELKPTYSPLVGFCPKCMRQVRYKKIIKENK